MTSLLTTALVGFFAYAGGAIPALAASQISQSPQTPAYPAYQVTLTAYNATLEQTDGDPHITASGNFSNPDIVAARSVDLADELPFGTVISITPSATSSRACGFGLVETQVGLRVIADSMHSRMRNKVDILFDADLKVKVGGKLTNPARALGICKNFTIEVVGSVDPRHMPKNQTELKAAIGEAGLAVK
jgi:3D (Asp-Asp-Asp) domain-containing protein